MKGRRASLGQHRGDVLLVSPHLDDAVLSCEAWISRENALDILTVFCGRPVPPVESPWDLEAGFANSDVALESRLAEDDAAFAGTPHRRQHLDLLDQQYLDRDRTPEEAASLAAWVTDWVTQAHDPLVLVPVGAGLRPPEPLARVPLAGRVVAAIERRLRRLWHLLDREHRSGRPPHIDHVWVSEVVTEALAPTGARLCFYAEFPYSRGGDGRRAIAAFRRAHGWTTLERLDVPVDRDRKARRVAAYRSQIETTSDAGGRLDEPRGLAPVETYWYVAN